MYVEVMNIIYLDSSSFWKRDLEGKKTCILIAYTNCLGLNYLGFNVVPIPHVLTNWLYEKKRKRKRKP